MELLETLQSNVIKEFCDSKNDEDDNSNEFGDEKNCDPVVLICTEVSNTWISLELTNNDPSGLVSPIYKKNINNYT